VSDEQVVATIPAAAIEAIAQRAAELVLERLAAEVQQAESYLALAQVAERVGFSTKAISRAIERGELPASKVCGRVRVRAADVDAWLAGNRIDPRQQAVAPTRSSAAKRPRGGPAKNGLCELLAAEPPA
jgi:excisionase family DNA binding protein